MRTTTTVLPVVVVFFLFFVVVVVTLYNPYGRRGGEKIDADSVRAKRNKKKRRRNIFFSLFVCGPKVCSFFLSLLGLLKTNGVRCCVCFLIPLYLLPLVGFFISLCAYARPPKDVRLCVCVLSLSHQQYSDRGPRTPPQGLLSFVNYFIDTQASCLLLFLVSCTFSFVCVCVYRGCDILVGDLVRLITFVSHALFGSCRIRLLLLPSSFWWRNLSIAPFSARTHPSMAAASTIDVA